MLRLRAPIAPQKKKNGIAHPEPDAAAAATAVAKVVTVVKCRKTLYPTGLSPVQSTGVSL